MATKKFPSKCKEMDAIIQKHPSWALLGQAKLIQKIRENYDDITTKEIKAWHAARESTQINKAPPTPQQTLSITAPPYSFQIDIFFLPAFARKNNGITQALLLVDILSRRAWAYPLANGQMPTVLEAYEQFLKELYTSEELEADVNSVQGDAFFNNKQFIEFNRELDITVWADSAKDDHITSRGDKLGIIDRATRTLKKMIRLNMDETGMQNWTDWLQDVIITAYNDTPHSSLPNNATPDEVWADYDFMKSMYESARKKNANIFKDIAIELDSRVRVMQGSDVFDKEKQRYSTEIYTVYEQDGYRYKLKDSNGKLVKRLYRPNELQVVHAVSKRVQQTGTQNAIAQHKHGLRMHRAGLDTHENAPPVHDVTKPVVHEKRNEQTRASTRLKTGAAKRVTYH